MASVWESENFEIPAAAHRGLLVVRLSQPSKIVAQSGVEESENLALVDTIKGGRGGYRALRRRIGGVLSRRRFAVTDRGRDLGDFYISINSRIQRRQRRIHAMDTRPRS
jgi:hypothetical protein